MTLDPSDGVSLPVLSVPPRDRDELTGDWKPTIPAMPSPPGSLQATATRTCAISSWALSMAA